MSSFCTAKATHIFSAKKFQHICVSLDVNFNESLTNDIVSFEQLGPDLYKPTLDRSTPVSRVNGLWVCERLCGVSRTASHLPSLVGEINVHNLLDSFSILQTISESPSR